MALEQTMTARQVYENLLRELNKVNAPSLHLEDYNYFINRAIMEYINRRYNLYDTSQQTTDDLQVLTSSAYIQTDNGKLSADIGKAAASTADANAVGTISAGALTLPTLLAPLPLANPVYLISTTSGVLVSLLNLPVGYSQITLLFDVSVGGTLTFQTTNRSQAVSGKMVMMGNANSIFTVPAASANVGIYGKSFKIDNGVLIEIPFSGNANLVANLPVKGVVNSYPTVEFSLPENYYHMLNCVVNFTVEKSYKCYPAGSLQPFTARRLTADMYAAILNNAFMKPDYRRPYYYIQNQQGKVTPIAEIRAGDYQEVFSLTSINIDYLRTPQLINLTTVQRDSLTDSSQVMEFPNYVNNEIIKIATAIVMENASDPRIQTHIPINQSIPQNPPGMPQQK